jgi:hypothetical protein
MRFSDITDQDLATLTEAPMGFMKSLTTGAKALLNPSLSGRKQAQGQFKTGRSANQIYGEFYKWLGSTQEEQNPTTSNVIAFLQQQGYGQQAIAAAQKAFPKAPDTAAPAQPAASTNQKLTPQQQNAMKARLQGQRSNNKTTATQTGTGFKNYVAGSGQRIQGANPDGSPKVVTVNRESREWLNEAGIPLNKDQLSAIFTAVAQSRAMPPAAQTTGAAGSNTAAPDTDNSSNQTQSSNPSNQQAQASGLPARLTAEQILNYYANLTSPYERDQVKKGIAEIDKQLGQ